MNSYQAIKYRSVNWYRVSMSSYCVKEIAYAQAWCTANISRPDLFWTLANNGLFLFFKEEDATRFSLTWL